MLIVRMELKGLFLQTPTERDELQKRIKSLKKVSYPSLTLCDFPLTPDPLTPSTEAAVHQVLYPRSVAANEAVSLGQDRYARQYWNLPQVLS